MTNKQQLFIEEYLIDLNATQAAIRAGYSEKTAGQSGERTLKNVEVGAAITAALEARSERTEVTQDMVIEGLSIEANRTGEGSSHAARVSAWGLLAKHLGMFIERVHHTGEVTATIRAMSDEELVERISQFSNRFANQPALLSGSTNGDGS